MRSDLHHLYPTYNRVNGARSNFPFGEVPDNQTRKWYRSPDGKEAIPAENIRDEFSEVGDRVFEPREDHKGNVARSMVYFWVIYRENNITPGFIRPQLPTLLRWHLEDPVDEAELARTRAIQEIQGRPNPFVIDETLLPRVIGLEVNGPSFDAMRDSVRTDKIAGIASALKLNSKRVVNESSVPAANFHGMFSEAIRRAEAADDSHVQQHRVATWNLEAFHNTDRRGFPEKKNFYRARKQESYNKIAKAIKDMELRVVCFQEINGYTSNRKSYSSEMDRLMRALDSNGRYKYVIGTSGRKLRIALMYDTRYVELLDSYEFRFTNRKIGDNNGSKYSTKATFDRQPLAGYFRFKEDDKNYNDFIVIGVHLASEQWRVKNHDYAMSKIQQGLRAAQADGSLPADEADILIMGDFNSNRFDNRRERFWTDMESSGWDVLADSKSSYGATRLSGNPLRQKSSRIDYIVVTDARDEEVNDGLQGDEIRQETARIHTELLGSGAEFYRTHYSDHLPVSVDVSVTRDGD